MTIMKSKQRNLAPKPILRHTALRLGLATASTIALMASAYHYDANAAEATAAATGASKAGSALALEEITVVAQKRSESLQDVPIAVTALNAKSIREMGYQNSLQLAEQVPNLQIRTSYSATNPVIYIRGIGNGDYNSNAVGGVGTYFDDVYIQAASGQVMQMFDLQQIEVLRGPQGTLYGKNTTGGAINFIPAKPTDDFEARVASKVGNFARVDFEGMISGPITDNLLGRLSFTRKSRDGYAKNIAYDQDGNVERKDDANNEDAYAGRVQLEWRGSDRANVRLNVHMGRDKSKLHMHGFRGLAQANGVDLITNPVNTYMGGAKGQGIGYNAGGWREPENNAQTGSINFVGPDDIKTFGAILNASYDFDGFTLKSITAYEQSSRNGMEDADASPLQITEVRWDTKNRQYSQEFQLVSNGNAHLDWIVGVHAFYEKLSANNNWELFHDPVFATHPDFAGFYGATVREVYQQGTTSYAAFGQATWHLTDRLNVTGGLRWTYEKRTWDNQNWLGATYEPFSAADPSLVLFDLDLSKDWKKLTWKGQVDYSVTDNVMVYAGVSTGFKSGGYNAGAQLDASFVGPFNPETLTAYEGGIKSTLFDNRVRANIAAFWYDFKDQQAFLYEGGGISYVDNAASSTIKGIELDLTALVTEHLNIQGGLAYTDAKFDQFIAGGGGGDRSGNRLPAAPKWNFNVAADYTVPVGVNSLTFRGEFTYSSNMYYDTSQTAAVSSLGSTTNTNARIAYSMGDGQYEVALWAHNIFDKTNVIDIYPLLDFGYYDEVIYNQPRMYGMEVTINFN